MTNYRMVSNFKVLQRPEKAYHEECDFRYHLKTLLQLQIFSGNFFSFNLPSLKIRFALDITNNYLYKQCFEIHRGKLKFILRKKNKVINKTTHGID